MAVWRLVTYHIPDQKDDMLRWAIGAQRMALGWALIGDLRTGGFTTPQSIAAAIAPKYPKRKDATPGGRCLWEFWHVMQLGDLVILRGATRRAVMRVTGPYEFAPPPAIAGGDYRHQREGEVLDLNADTVWKQSGGMAKGYNIHWPLLRCARAYEMRRLLE